MGFLTAAACGAAVVVLGLNGITDAVPFNAIVPNLSTGWFAKPGPAESLVFGLMVLKVMALRLAGVFPYKLNDLWSEGYLDQIGWRRKSKAKRDLFFSSSNKFSKAPLLKEIDAVERILLGLRRIDSHDCFIRHVCQVKQNQLAGKSSAYEDAILQVFSLKPKREAVKGEMSVWDMYHEALTPEIIDCNQKYQMCPLTKSDMKLQNLITGLF